MSNKGKATGQSTIGYMLHGGTQADLGVNVIARFTPSSNGSGIGLLVHYADASNHYRFRNNAGTMSIGKAGTTISSTAAYAMVGGSTYWIRAIASPHGDGSLDLTLKMWDDGSDESTATVITYNDASPYTANLCGIMYTGNAAGRTLLVDSFSISNLITTNTRTVSSVSSALKTLDSTHVIASVSSAIKKLDTVRTVGTVSSAIYKLDSARISSASLALLATKTRAASVTGALSSAAITNTRTLSGISVSLINVIARTVATSSAFSATLTRATPQSAAFLTQSLRVAGVSSSFLGTYPRAMSTSVPVLKTFARNASSTTPILITKTRAWTQASAILQTSTRGIGATVALYAYREVASTVPLLLTKNRASGASVSTSTAIARGMPFSVSLDTAVLPVRNISATVALSAWLWLYKKKVTIVSSQVPATMTNYPLLFSVTDADLKTSANGGKLQNGNDLVFYDSAEATLLDYEIEKYDATTGELVAWVRVPSVSSTVNTDIWLYFGNTAITTSQQNKVGVWTNGAVYHFSENPTGTAPQMKDSVGTNHLTVAGAWSGNTSAKIDGGLNFNGTDDVASCASASALLPSGDMTLSFWVYLNQRPSVAAKDFMLCSKSHSAAPWYSYQVYCSMVNNTIRGNWVNTTQTDTPVVGTTALLANTWYFVAFVRSSTGMKVYINGVDDTTSGGTPTGTIYASTNPFSVGGVTAKNSNAIIDDIKLVPSARTANWLLAEYRNQNSPLTFFTVGSLIGVTVKSRTVSDTVAILQAKTRAIVGTTSLASGITRVVTMSSALFATRTRAIVETGALSGTLSTRTRTISGMTACLHYSITQSPYGITHFINFNNPFLLPQQDINDMAGIGCKGFGDNRPILRYQITWGHCEPTQHSPAQYDWSNLDDAIPRCNAAGIAVWVQLSMPPQWYCSIDINGGNVPLGDATAIYATYDKWTPYVDAITTRYNGRHGHGFVDFWQLENEEYDLHGSYAQRNAHAYLIPPVMNACYPIMKANSPDALVVLPAMRGTDAANEKKHFDSWLGYVAANCGDNYDGIDYHYYVNAVVNAEPNVMDGNYMTITQRLQYIRGILAPYRPDKPFITMGEFGWPMYDDGTGTNILRTPTVNGNWICEVFDAFQVLEPTGKAIIFTMRSDSHVNSTTGVADAPRSLVQTINSAYTYTNAYTIVANYIADNPLWVETGRNIPAQVALRGSQTGVVPLSVTLSYTVGTTLHSDDFTRTVASGLGVASDGDSYTFDGSTATWSVNGTNASCTGIASGASCARHGNGVLGDVDIQVDVRLSTNAPTAGIFFRGVATDCYFAGIANQVLTLSRIATNVSTTLASQAYPVTANTWYTVRVLAIGGNLYVKAWQTGQGEPTSWTLAMYDSMYTSGPFGMRVTAGNIARVMDLDNFTVRTADTLPSTPSRSFLESAALLATRERVIASLVSMKGENAVNIFVLSSLAYLGLSRTLASNGTFFRESVRNVSESVSLLRTGTQLVSTTCAVYSYRAISLSGAFLASPSRTVSETAAIGAYAARACVTTSAFLKTQARTISETAAILSANQRYIGVYASVYIQRVTPVSGAFLQVGIRNTQLSIAVLRSSQRLVGQSVATLASVTRGISSTTACNITRSRTVLCSTPLMGSYQRSFVADGATALLTQNISASVATIIYGNKPVPVSGTFSGVRQRVVSETAGLFQLGTRVTAITTPLVATRAKTVSSTVSLVGLRSSIASASFLETRNRGLVASAALSLTGVYAHNALSYVALSLAQGRVVTPTGATGLAGLSRECVQSVAIQKASTRTTTLSSAFLETRARGITPTLASQITMQKTIGTSSGLYMRTTFFIPNSMAIQTSDSRFISVGTPTQQEKGRSILVSGSLLAENICQSLVFVALRTTQDVLILSSLATQARGSIAFGTSGCFIQEVKRLISSSLSLTTPVTGLGRNISSVACLQAHRQKSISCSASLLMSNALVTITSGHASLTIHSGHAHIGS